MSLDDELPISPISPGTELLLETDQVNLSHVIGTLLETTNHRMEALGPVEVRPVDFIQCRRCTIGRVPVDSYSIKVAIAKAKQCV